MRGTYVAGLLFALLASISQRDIAFAAEDSTGVYLLGIKASMAGFLPPPGTYFSDTNYYYTGDASGSAAVGRGLRRLGPITTQADVVVDARAFVSLPSILWVTPYTLLGGNLALGVIAPVAWKDVTADVDVLTTLTLPNGRTLTAGRQFRFSDDTTAFGDPLVTATLGWHEGNWHWNLAGLLNVPIGQYNQVNLANIGFNHWAFDASAAVTWLDPAKGFEVSLSPGFTFNWENPDTNYRTGTELHFEFALMQHFSHEFAVGLAGYHYQQITGDSGSGAVLGDFKGRVTGVGPNLNYNFQVGRVPISTSLRWQHEFNAKNRTEGDAVFLSAAIPLGFGR